MAELNETIFEIDGRLTLPSLVLAGGFVYQPGVGIVPIPNGVYHEGQIAISAVIALRQYATVATTPLVSNALNSAADNLANELAVPIANFKQVLAEKIGEIT
jgi:hypothetical protein